MRTLVVIPARYASTRFPGKPLALLGGKPIIQWVWEHVNQAAESTDAMVATDDERILQAVRQFGGQCMLTADTHRSGTDRCGEVLRSLEAQEQQYDVVINVQGDEPFVEVGQIKALVDCFAVPDTQIATLKTVIRSAQELNSPNNVKVICSPSGRAVYFSRQPIPYLRGIDPEQWLQHQSYFKHVGIYAFRAQVLKEVTCLSPSPLEMSESLEQLRWLENGYAIQVAETTKANIGIDTPEDLMAAEQFLLETQSKK